MDLTGVLQLQEEATAHTETHVTTATDTSISPPQAPQTETKGGEAERQGEQEGNCKDTRVKELEVTSSPSVTEKGDSVAVNGN